MLTTKRFLAVFLIALTGVLPLAGCAGGGGGGGTGAGAEPLKLGAVLPLSGDASNYGKSAQRGINLAVKEINAAGGVMGRQLQPIFEDDKAVARDGVNATQKLINVDKVPVIVGGITSAVTLAAAPICESNKVVWLSPTGSAPAITSAGEYIFRNFPSDDIEGKVMADLIHTKGHKSVAILQVQNDYGEGIAKVFKTSYEGQGGSVPVLEKYKQDESDFRSLVTKAINAKPEAIYFIGYYKDVALAAKQAREAGTKVPFYATTTVEDPQFLQTGGSAVEGVIYPLASGFDKESTDASIQKFRDAYRREYQEDPGFVEAQAYDCVYLVKQAIENAKGTTGPDIQRGMAQIKNFPGAAGVTSFDQNGDVVKQIRLKVVRDGKFVPYEQAAAAAGR